MKELFTSMLQALSDGQSVVLCSILASSGSTPRPKYRRAIDQMSPAFSTTSCSAADLSPCCARSISCGFASITSSRPGG